MTEKTESSDANQLPILPALPFAQSDLLTVLPLLRMLHNKRCKSPLIAAGRIGKRKRP